MDNPLIPTVKYATLITEGNGTQTAWDFNFAGGYISPEHVKAFTEDVATGELVIRPLTLIGPNTAQITPPVADGLRLIIYRDTPKTEPLVDYSTGSILNESSLDKSNKQAVFIAAELADRVIADYDFSNALLYAVTTAAEAKVIAAGIDAKATTALSQSGTALAAASAAEASAADSALLRTQLATAVGASLVGWRDTTAGALLDIVYYGAVSVHAAPYNAKGDGVTDDTAAIQAAFNSGKTVQFGNRKLYRTTATLLLDIEVLKAQNFQSQTVQLSGSAFVVEGANNWLTIRGWPYVPGTHFIVEGMGARVSGTSGTAGGGIVVIGGYGHKIENIEFRGFTSCVHLTVENISHWCESVVVRGVRGLDFQYGIRTTSVGGDVSASFDQTHLEYCEFNCTRNGSVGYALDGFHGRLSMVGCGVWLGEDGAVDTVGWYLNGTTPGGVMMACWADGGSTHSNTIQFGPGYPNTSEVNSSAGSALTVIGTGIYGDIANYLKLPPGWQWALKVLDSSSVYGAAVHLDTTSGTGTTRTAAPGAILHFSATFYHARGSVGSLYTRSIALPLGARRLLSYAITPFAGGVDSQARSAGFCGVLNENYALGVPTSLDFFMIPTNLNGTGGGEGCNYRVSVTLQMN